MIVAMKLLGGAMRLKSVTPPQSFGDSMAGLLHKSKVAFSQPAPQWSSCPRVSKLHQAEDWESCFLNTKFFPWTCFIDYTLAEVRV